MSSLQPMARRDTDKAAWDASAADFSQAWFWHQWDAIEAFASWSGAQDHSFAIVDAAAGGGLVCLCPVLWFPGRAPATRWLSRLESTGGPVVSDGLSRRQRENVCALAAQTLRAIAGRTGAYRVDLSFSPLAPARLGENAGRINPAVDFGFKDSSTHSWIVDLRGHDEDSLWMMVDQRVRKTVKKARRSGGAVRRADADDVPLYMDLHRRSCRRLGIAPKPEAYFEAILGKFRDDGKAAAFVGSSADGEALSIHTFARNKGAALYWTVASDEKAMDTGLNSLVQWEAMRYFLDAGVKFYETGEAFPLLRGGKLKRISDFKKGFGATLHPYYRGTLIRKPALAAGLELTKALINRNVEF